MRAYKLMRLKNDGKVYPLFINKTVPTEFGVWLTAECHPTKGFAVRKGWHCCFIPYAPHLKEKLSNGEQRVWVECEVEDYTTYDRPESQGGAWILANRMKAIRTMTMEEAKQIKDMLIIPEDHKAKKVEALENIFTTWGVPTSSPFFNAVRNLLEQED